MKALFGDPWTRLDEEAVSFVGESKPLRARYAAQRLDDFDFVGKAGERFDMLVQAIRGGGPVNTLRENASDEHAPGASPWESHDHDPWGPDEPPF